MGENIENICKWCNDRGLNPRIHEEQETQQQSNLWTKNMQMHFSKCGFQISDLNRSIAAQFAIPKKRNQPKCPWMNIWIKKCGRNNMVYYSTIVK